MKTTVTDLRAHLTRYLDHVLASGERLLIRDARIRHNCSFAVW